MSRGFQLAGTRDITAGRDRDMDLHECSPTALQCWSQEADRWAVIEIIPLHVRGSPRPTKKPAGHERAAGFPGADLYRLSPSELYPLPPPANPAPFPAHRPASAPKGRAAPPAPQAMGTFSHGTPGGWRREAQNLVGRWLSGILGSCRSPDGTWWTGDHQPACSSFPHTSRLHFAASPTPYFEGRRHKSPAPPPRRPHPGRPGARHRPG